jgi:hypothetical protein
MCEVLGMIVIHDQDLQESPESALERKLIEEYLLNKGYQKTDLRGLPAQEVSSLMKEACRYASLRLAEIEARSKFRRKIGAR